MAQVPGLGLDQSQLADVINQQYKGYSQKQRNQMMQSAAASPDNWSAITQKSNQQASMPTEFLGAGRTSDIPAVSMDGQKLTGYDDSNLSSLYNMNPNYKGVDFDYTDSAGKGYFNTETQNRIESSAPNFISGAKTGYDLNPTKAGGYYFSDPWGFSHSVDKVGNNKYFVSADTLNQHTRSGTADTFYGLDKTKDLSGLFYGQNQGKAGLFFDPTKTNLSSLLTPQRNNSAYADPGHGFFGDFGKIVEPVGNILGAIYSSGVPWGSILVGVDNAASGNWEGVGNNAINGIASYAGSSVGSGGVMGTNASLGSAAANSAANNMIISAGANYARTGDLENALKAAAFSTTSGAAGNWLGSATAGDLGEIGSKALGGAASGGLNSLFTKNSPIEGSLFGAMSGGLHGFLNSTDKQNNTFNKERNIQNRRQAQNLTKLAKLFVKK